MAAFSTQGLSGQEGSGPWTAFWLGGVTGKNLFPSAFRLLAELGSPSLLT